MESSLLCLNAVSCNSLPLTLGVLVWPGLYLGSASARHIVVNPTFVNNSLSSFFFQLVADSAARIEVKICVLFSLETKPFYFVIVSGDGVNFLAFFSFVFFRSARNSFEFIYMR